MKPDPEMHETETDAQSDASFDLKPCGWYHIIGLKVLWTAPVKTISPLYRCHERDMYQGTTSAGPPARAGFARAGAQSRAEQPSGCV